ncbi:MAG: hypothetical protein IPJ76_10225 [Flavobacteriales bacterium]|nr:MAG: hypothetical protein IPJ76_10225 [Flavobacteriales bacterium]
MKHFHSKSQLGEDDVKYIIVEKGERLTVRFGEVDKDNDGAPISQGIKLWLNRCELLLGEVPVEAGRVIIWHAEKPKPMRVSGGHAHIYAKEVILTVGKTSGENANLGLFNVWTSDNQRCYEFSRSSSISDKDQKRFTARHGWSKSDKATMAFEIERTPLANG